MILPDTNIPGTLARVRALDLLFALFSIKDYNKVPYRPLPPVARPRPPMGMPESGGFAQKMIDERVRHANSSPWRSRRATENVGIKGLMTMTCASSPGTFSKLFYNQD